MSVSLTTESTEVTEKSTEKNESVDAYIIGQIQLESAIQHYNEGNYICAITLAGATNTLLSSMIKNISYNPNNAPTALNITKDMLINKYKIKEEDIPNLSTPRNSLKHYEELIKKSINTSQDNYKKLAEREIRFAAFNYVVLTKKPTEKISVFIDCLNDTINPVPSSVPSVTSVVKNSTEDLNTISGKIINCAINVHKQLGAGLLESAYQHGLAYTMAKDGLKFSREKIIPIMIDNHKLDEGYRADFIVENKIIIETKSVEKLNSNHEAQILNYMRLGNFPIGLLMNFNETLLKNGLKRFKI